ncbi:MAG: holo-ACP synthase [Methanocorpusculum sp.]|nr:holo-ACP synthase [Methanocorpusculum sp.]
MRIFTGCDIVRTGRFTSHLDDKRFLDRCFTEAEQAYCFEKASPEEHFVARFAGKETVLKAFSGSGIRYPIGSVEILNKPSGRPIVRISNDEAVPDGFCIEVSLSHEDEYAAASSVVCFSDDKSSRNI